MRQRHSLLAIVGILFLLAGICNAVVFPMKSILKTDDTFLELTITENGLYVTRLSNGESGWNWAEGSYKMPLFNKIAFIKGTTTPVVWKVTNVIEGTDFGKKVVVEFTSREPKMRLRSTWWAHYGPGPVEHFIELINDSTVPVEVGIAPSLDMCLRLNTDKYYEHWWIEKGSFVPSTTGVHRALIERSFNYEGISTPYDNTGATSRDLNKFNENVPWQCIHNATEKHGIYTGIESSARVVQKTNMVGPGILRTVLKLDESLGMFKTKLTPYEVYKFPPVFMGCFRGDLDDAGNRLHRWLERWVCPPSVYNLPLLVNNSWGSEMEVDEPMAKNMIQDCVNLGLEMYHVDAGWFKAVGWWHEDLNKFPNGLRYISDYARSRNLKFGLWTGWTQGGDRDALAGGSQALSVFDPARKNWFAEDLPADWNCPGPFTGECVCLAHQPAFEWCLNDMSRCVIDYKLDLLEHDQQMLIWDCKRTNHGHSLSAADISNRAAWNYYKVHETLMRKYPKLLIENCVNGGRMMDFGVIRYSHYTCGNDRYYPLALRQTFHDLSYMMPPRIIEGYLSKGGVPTGGGKQPLRYRLRSAMLGMCTLMMMGSKDWDSVQYAEAKNIFATYKQYLRPQIREGNLYHISSRPNGTNWDAYEYYTPAKGTGVVYVFRDSASSVYYSFKLKGLDAAANYTLKSQDGYSLWYSASGKSLMESGFWISIPGQYWSDLVYITKQ